jgi:hypothetical protein
LKGGYEGGECSKGTEGKAELVTTDIVDMLEDFLLGVG